jgi:hypothetical protein
VTSFEESLRKYRMPKHPLGLTDGLGRTTRKEEELNRHLMLRAAAEAKWKPMKQKLWLARAYPEGTALGASSPRRITKL